MPAPFLKEGFGWIESDICWWCGTGRQTREHCFKKCRTWKHEIKRLWKGVGEASTGKGGNSSRVCKGKGFGYGVSRGTAGPGNITVRDLLADERFSETVLFFLESTKVGMVKAGVIQRG